jgi:quercetin dioxygenase-like cupin family protein
VKPMIPYQTAKSSAGGFTAVLDGVERKTLVYGENTLLSAFKLTEGKLLPIHKHPQEQTGYLVSGHLVLIINGERHDMTPGDSWTIPGNVEHGAEILADSLAVEVFSPVREDYLPERQAQDGDR